MKITCPNCGKTGFRVTQFFALKRARTIECSVCGYITHVSLTGKQRAIIYFFYAIALLPLSVWFLSPTFFYAGVAGLILIIAVEHVVLIKNALRRQ